VGEGKGGGILFPLPVGEGKGGGILFPSRVGEWLGVGSERLLQESVRIS